MADNEINLKIVADASGVSSALDGAATSVKDFAGSVATSSGQLGLFATTEAAVSQGAASAGQQLALFAQETAKAGEQMSLFAANGAQVVPVLESVALGSTDVAERLTGLPKVLETITEWFVATGEAALQMGEHVREGALEAIESVTAFAEGVDLAKLSTISAFTLIGEAFAAIAIVGILAEVLEKLQDVAIEAGHLSEATGVSAVKIIELKEAMLAAGAPADQLQQNVGRLVKSMEAAAEGSKKQSEAFKALGVDTSDWHDKLPPIDDVLQQISTHLQGSTKNIQDMAEVQVVAGRNVVGLTAFLKSQGEGLGETLEKHKEYAEAVEKAIGPAQQLRALEAQLSETFKTLAIQVLPSVITAFQLLLTSFAVIKEAMYDLGQTIDALVVFPLEVLVGVAKGAAAALTGDFAGAASAVKRGWSDAKDSFAFFNSNILDSTRKTTETIASYWAKAKPEPDAAGGTNTPAPDTSKAAHVQELALQGEKTHQVALLEAQRKGYEDQEKLGEISADANLARLIKNNDDILAVQLDFNARIAAVAKQDPNGKDHVQELANERISVVDKALADETALRQKAAEKDSDTAKKLFKDELASEQALAAEGEKIRTKADAAQQRSAVAAQTYANKITAAQTQALELELAGEEKHLNSVESLYQKDVEFRNQLGLVSNAQKDAMLQASYARETQLQQDSLTKQLAALDQNSVTYVAKKQELNNKLQALEDQLSARQQATDQARLKQTATTYSSFINTVGSAFQTNIDSWIKGTQTFSQAFATMGTQILSGWISTLVQMGVKWAEHQALKLALEVTGLGQQAAAQTAADSTAVATGAVSALAQVAQNAGVAASGAYAATALIPFVGPALAPAAAATALAGALSFGSVAAFEQGGIVGSDSLAMVHKNEMVLPATLSQGFQSLLGGGSGVASSTSLTSGAQGPSTGSPGGSTQASFHFAPVVQALDATGVNKVLQDHQKVFIRNIQNWRRNGHLSVT